MGINSTEVAYGFGQMGSVFTDVTDPVYAPHGKVIVAIQFIAKHGLTVLTSEKRAVPSSGTSHAHQPLPEFAGIAVAANDLGDCVIASASSSGTTVTHNANANIKVGMQVVSLTDADYPRDGIEGQPVIIEEILTTTTFRVSSNASGTTLSSQSLAGLSLHSSGYGGKAINNLQAFPTGIIIYGRWTDVKLKTADSDGGIICYFGY
jgi:hypothetical protein